MSPKVVIIKFSFLDRAIISSMYEMGVTHTGQPGPEIRLIFEGRIFLIPFLNMATV